MASKSKMTTKQTMVDKALSINLKIKPDVLQQ